MNITTINLDDLETIHRLDAHAMLAEIDALPQQLQSAWELGQAQPLFTPGKPISRVLIAGMGGSAIAADLVSAHAAASCSLPVFVHRNYGLPAWAQGAETLVIASSHSGNTEETLETFEAARVKGCTLLALCTGGELARRSSAAGIPLWTFTHGGQPRAAIGYSFGMLLAAFTRLGFLSDPAAALQQAIAAMRQAQTELLAQVPAENNPAKRLAARLAGNWVVVYGSDMLAPVARRWKGQINELAKAGAGFEFLPEADHNTMAGAYFPPQALPHTFHIFLDSSLAHPRNRKRSALTRQALVNAGLQAEAVEATGESPLAQMWTSVLFGDYTTFYLAMLYGIDPWDTSMLERFKKEMKEGG